MSPRLKLALNGAPAVYPRLRYSIGKPLNSGPTHRAVGHSETCHALSDRTLLALHAQVEITSTNGRPSTFFDTTDLLNSTYLFHGFTQSGFPVLLEIWTGHLMIVGPTQSWKSVTCASLGFQLLRMGHSVIYVGLKAFDPLLYSSCKLGCEALTRLDVTGNPMSAPFEFFSLQPGLNSKAFNFHLQRKDSSIPKWILSGSFLQALGAGSGAGDATRRYYLTYANTILQSFDWGKSFQELCANARKLKLDRDTKYAVAGVFNEVGQLASVELANRKSNDPTNIDLERLLLNQGGAYFDCCAQDVGGIATAFAGLILQATIAVKRAVLPDRNKRVIVFIDEAQMFPRDYLKQLIEQAASSGVVLVLAYHTLDQMGDDWETISMTQARMFLGAVPGGSTDKHIQALFGTHTVFRRSLSESAGFGVNFSASASSGTGGNTTSIGVGTSFQRQCSFSLTEAEEFVWTPNDTLELNADPDRFVLHDRRGPFGPRPIVAQRGGSFLDFDTINRVAQEAFRNSSSLLDQPRPSAQSPTVSEQIQARREEWLSVLRATAEQIKKESYGSTL